MILDGVVFSLSFFWSFCCQETYERGRIAIRPLRNSNILPRNSRRIRKTAEHDGPFQETICLLNRICFKVKHVSVVYVQNLLL